MVDDLPEALLETDSVESLVKSLQEMMMVALTGGDAPYAVPRATREAQRVVLRADAFLHSRMDRPIYSHELCAAVGVSQRKLHDAFVATVGVSPHSYLKARRLAIVRRTLQHSRPALVKSVALAHGFWHGGHFARDYRLMFGETPSETAGHDISRRGNTHTFAG
jgi:AraC family ethanolamine operon transcriptional activator